MSRGSAIGRVMLALVLSMSLVMGGCSTNWINEAEEISAALIPAAANLVALVAALQGKNVSAQDVAVIQNAGTQAGADLQLVQSLIAAYEKADASAQPGILNQIQSALNVAQSDLQGILPALHIKDAATQAKITAVVGVLISEVQSLAAVVPLVQGSATGAVSAKVSLLGNQNPGAVAHNAARMGQPSVPLSARDFVKSYNSVLTAKSGNASVDSAARALQVHLHGAALRWASAGVLQ